MDVEFLVTITERGFLIWQTNKMNTCFNPTIFLQCDSLHITVSSYQPVEQCEIDISTRFNTSFVWVYWRANFISEYNRVTFTSDIFSSFSIPLKLCYEVFNLSILGGNSFAFIRCFLMEMSIWQCTEVLFNVK